jgi:hypothetical protein
MLRAILLALVVANLGYFGWTRGAFAVFGFVPASLTETEPQRLANQLHPEWLQIRVEDAAAQAPLPSGAASAPETAASATDR